MTDKVIGNVNTKLDSNVGDLGGLEELYMLYAVSGGSSISVSKHSSQFR
jgi:hypothetical protein